MTRAAKYVVVSHDPYDGVDVVGPFVLKTEAEAYAERHGGRARRVVPPGGVFSATHRYVAIEACVLGGITVHGWFPSRDAAEAHCHRLSLLGAAGSRFAAAAVS